MRAPSWATSGVEQSAPKRCSIFNSFLEERGFFFLVRRLQHDLSLSLSLSCMYNRYPMIWSKCARCLSFSFSSQKPAPFGETTPMESVLRIRTSVMESPRIGWWELVGAIFGEPPLDGTHLFILQEVWGAQRTFTSFSGCG